MFEGGDPIDLANVRVLKQKPFYVAPKMDGVRYLMYHDSTKPANEKTYLINRKGEKIVYQCEDLLKREILYDSLQEKMIPTGKSTIKKKLPMPFTLAKKFVIDLEKINNHKFYILDILQIDAMDLREKPFSFRYEMLKGSFYEIDKNDSSTPCCFFVLEYMPWFPEITLESILKNHHPTDGIIFVSKEGNYSATKWRYKLIDTIDFEAETSGNLKVLVGSGQYQRTEAFRLAKNYFAYTKDYVKKNKIYECAFNYKTRQWVVIRQRTDKVKPNRLHVARYIFYEIILKKRFIRPFQ